MPGTVCVQRRASSLTPHPPNRNPTFQVRQCANDACHARPVPPVALPRPDPLEPPCRQLPAAVADAFGAVDRSAGLSRLASDSSVHARHLPDAQRGLCRQRRGRPRLRQARQAHRTAAGHAWRGQPEGGAGARRSACLAGLCAGADHQRRDHPLELRCTRTQHRLPVHQAFLLDAAGSAGRGLQLWHPDGLRSRSGGGSSARVAAAARQPVLGTGLRHRIRDGRS